jgi:hypothetical protein
MSAYEIAVANGFSGTEAEWLTSLEASYTLPTASATTLGGIKVGNNLTITDGVLSANQQYSITISSSGPSGGADGDIWFVYTV